MARGRYLDAHHVILAGGSGTRFWPASRSARPKQFLSLTRGRPLLRQAFDRAAAMSGADRVYVSAGSSQWPQVKAILPELPAVRFIGEPVARNTAPGVGLSALRLSRVDPEAVMVMAPADHVYADEASLQKALTVAAAAARATGALVTLGIRPTRPETGYGYIEVAGEAGSEDVLDVKRFVEKPDEATARRFLAAGSFYWNSGLFVWTAAAILSAIRACAPDLAEPLDAIAGALGTAGEGRAIAQAFERMPSISIDYAVLERAGNVKVVPADPGWSDVGSWDAVADLLGSGPAGNVVTGDETRVLFAGDAANCFVHQDSRGRVVALVGVEDLIVVDTGDALLVCRKGRSQSVREVVDRLKKTGGGDLT